MDHSDFYSISTKVNIFFFIKVNDLKETYPVFTSYLFDYRRDDHARSATDCIHDTIKETSKVWCKILIVRQIGDKSSAVETQCQEQKDVCKYKVTSDVADQY